MAKFHITKAGKTEPCRASQRACPLGEENHYPSLAEAARASADRPTPNHKPKQGASQAWKAWRDEASGDTVPVPAESRSLLFQGFLKGMERDIRGRGVADFLTGDTKELAGLSDEEFAQLREAHTKPYRLTPTEERKVEEALAVRGLTRQEVDDYADGRILNVPSWRGVPHYFHPTRHVASLALVEGIVTGYERAADRLLMERAAQAKNPRHPYGSFARKVEFEDIGGPREPKPIDPAIIEALKLKYLKKFKQPFNESGLSIGELLQMARKGELD